MSQCVRIKRNGERCKRPAIAGGEVCGGRGSHGGNAPQVRRKAAERVALAKALAADPRRDPTEVLADVAHQADYLMRRAREEIRTDALTADTMARLIEVTEAAGRWAKTGIDAGVAERQTRVIEAQAAALAGVIQRVLDGLDLSPSQLERAPSLVVYELERMAPKALEAGRE